MDDIGAKALNCFLSQSAPFSRPNDARRKCEPFCTRPTRDFITGQLKEVNATAVVREQACLSINTDVLSAWLAAAVTVVDHQDFHARGEFPWNLSTVSWEDCPVRPTVNTQAWE